MSDVDRTMAAILDAARQAHDPAPEDAERVRLGLLACIASTTMTAAGEAAAGGASAVAGAAGAGTTAWLGPTAVTIGKLASVGLVMGAAGFGLGVATSSRSSDGSMPAGSRGASAATASASAAVPSPRLVRTVPPPTSAMVVSVPPPSVMRPAAPEPEAVPASSPLLLAKQAAALKQAERNLEQDPTRALRILEDMEREHPEGALAEEAQAARVIAYCNLDQVDAAREAAGRFLATYPASVHAARVRASCAANSPARNAESKRDASSAAFPLTDSDRGQQ